jgi:hypothetical protein
MSFGPLRGRRVTASALAAALLFGAPAGAQQARDPVAAEALFNSGLTALDQGDWATACEKFRASYTLDPSPGTSINVARCLEQEGKLATAWLEYQTAKKLNRDTVVESRRAQVDAYATRQIAALEPRLPRLRIVVQSPPPGLTVERDGVSVASGALGESLPIDPGTHRIVVRAPGHAEETRDVKTVEGATADVTIVLRPVASVPAPVPPPLFVPPPPPPREPERGLRGLQIGGIVVGSVGVAGLAVGAITGAMALSLKADVEAACDEETHTCSEDGSGLDDASTGSTVAAISTVGFVAGGALLATGIVLLVVGGDDGSTTRAGLSADPSSVGLFVHGAL